MYQYIQFKKVLLPVVERCSFLVSVCSILSLPQTASRGIYHTHTRLESLRLAADGIPDDSALPVMCGLQRRELVMGLSHRPASLIPSVLQLTYVQPATGNISTHVAISIYGTLLILLWFFFFTYFYKNCVNTFNCVNLSSLRCRIASCLVGPACLPLPLSPFRPRDRLPLPLPLPLPLLDLWSLLSLLSLLEPDV